MSVTPFFMLLLILISKDISINIFAEMPFRCIDYQYPGNF